MTREFFNDYMFVMLIILCIVEQVAKQFPVSYVKLISACCFALQLGYMLSGKHLRETWEAGECSVFFAVFIFIGLSCLYCEGNPLSANPAKW